MKAFVEEQEIGYPVAVDRDGATVAAYAVDSFPDYYLIDRQGRLRFADLANAEVERAVEMLLKEPAPTASADAAPRPEELEKALAEAKKKRKRVLVTFSAEESIERKSLMDALARRSPLGRFVFNEYAAIHLDPKSGAGAALVESWRFDPLRFGLVVLDAEGRELLRVAGASPEGPKALEPEKLEAALRLMMIPTRNAREVLETAKDEARRSKRRLLVHLGAPW